MGFGLGEADSLEEGAVEGERDGVKLGWGRGGGGGGSGEKEVEA